METPTIAEVSGPTVVPPLVVGRPSPLYEPSVISASFKPMPYRADTIVDGWTVDGVTVRGASLRGHQHRFNGAPREDDFAVHRLRDGRIIILVADGVSEAQQSHIGSAAAVRSASEWLHTSLAAETEATDWQHCFASVAWALNEQAQRVLGLAQPDPVATEANLATTLVCAVLEVKTPEVLRAHIVSVGDSSAWTLIRGSFTDLLATSGDGLDELSSSEVTGLPRVPVGLRPTIVDLSPGELLLVGTDGFGDPLGSGDGGVGNLFREVLSQPSPPTLIEFAHALDFSRESFDDDRTLVAVGLSGPANPRGGTW